MSISATSGASSAAAARPVQAAPPAKVAKVGGDADGDNDGTPAPKPAATAKPAVQNNPVSNSTTVRYA